MTPPAHRLSTRMGQRTCPLTVSRTVILIWFLERVTIFSFLSVLLRFGPVNADYRRSRLKAGRRLGLNSVEGELL
jgi:hypothetical protein